MGRLHRAIHRDRMVVVVRRYRLRVTGCGSRVLRFCHPSTPRRLFGTTARLPSAPHKRLRTPALAEPIGFSRESLADFRLVVYQ
jgi:hypothetical protein